MSLIKTFLVFFCYLSLTACATALKPVEYTGSPIKINTNKKVSIDLRTGVINGTGSSTMIAAGGVFVPMQMGSSPKLRFNEDDQKTFANSLKNEVAKLNIANIIENGNKDATIELIFAQTQHSQATQRYLLDVVMTIRKNKSVKFQKKYSIDSEKGVSFWTKMNTNAIGGKTRAAQYLMSELLPDIALALKKKI